MFTRKSYRIAQLEDELELERAKSERLSELLAIADEAAVVEQRRVELWRESSDEFEAEVALLTDMFDRSVHSNRWVPGAMNAQEMRFSVPSIDLTIVARSTGRKDNRLSWDLFENFSGDTGEPVEYLFHDARRDVVDAVIEDRLRRAVHERPAPLPDPVVMQQPGIVTEGEPPTACGGCKFAGNKVETVECDDDPNGHV